MKAILTFFILAATAFCTNAQPGVIDSTFNTMDIGFGYGDGADGSVLATAIQSDGKIIIGGGFYSYNGTSSRSIARLNLDGSHDTTFNPGTGASGYVNTIAIQSDGKIIIGGGFTSYNGTARNYIARLNSDGSLDNSFDPGTGTNGIVYATAVQIDGKIIIGGSFTSYNGTSLNRIARLNSDGSLDNTFNPGTGASGIVNTIAIQSDGKIIIGGNFTAYNGTTSNHVARLNTDGTLDATFNPGTGAFGNVNTIAIQNDGKIIIGGDFISYNGTSSNCIARINANGTLDATFNSGAGANYSIKTITIQSDGKFIIGGEFYSYNGNARNHIARINNNGSLDGTFNPGIGADTTVLSTAIQSDGKIIIGGKFTFYNGNGRNYIARINSDGTSDSTFILGTGANKLVEQVAIQSDGKIIIGGGFTSYNGTARNYIARLNTDGTHDLTFNPGSEATYYGTSQIAIQNDGKIISGAWSNTFNRYGFRLNPDGTLDPSFNGGIGPSDEILAIAIQSDGKIIYGGAFIMYNNTACYRLARLNSDGTLDVTFNIGTGANWTINTISIQNDGKIIIGGKFISYNGTARNRIARINSDGSLDNTFNPGTGASGDIKKLAIQSDGKIIISGDFTTYNGVSSNGIARLNTDGTLDTTFNCGTGASYLSYPGDIKTIAIQSDGKIIIGGLFTSYNGTTRNRIARINTDGSIDASFNPYGAGANNYVYAIAIQSDGDIVIGGSFTSYNGTGRNRIARIIGGECTPPTVSANSTATSVCPGTIITLTGSGAVSYTWTGGVNDGIPFVPTTTADYAVTGIDSAYCPATSSITITVQNVYQNEQICLVSVDTNIWKNKIMWEKTSDVGTAGYNIYKEVTTNVYNIIKYVPYNDIAEYVDTTSQPESYASRYKISVIDTCGNESAKSFYHNTMNLTIAAFGSTMGLTWTPYTDESGTFVPALYDIYRGTTPNNMTYLASIPGSQTSYNDVNVFTVYHYVVGVTKPGGCNTSKTDMVSFSNKKDNTSLIGYVGECSLKGVIKISPNPMNNKATLTVPYFEGKTKEPLQIMDITGKTVNIIDVSNVKYDNNNAEIVIERGDLKPGVYFVELKADRTYRGKLIVE